MPGFSVRAARSLGDLRGRLGRPLVGSACRVAARFPHRRSAFPTAEAAHPAFQREVGDVHRELYPEHADLYGENIRAKVERCIAVDDPSTRMRARPARAAQAAAEALDGFDLLLDADAGRSWHRRRMSWRSRSAAR